MIEHTTVATLGEFPIPRELKVLILLGGHDVTAGIATIALRLDATIHYVPRLRQCRAVVVFPAI